jgi:hypothetical protein
MSFPPGVEARLGRFRAIRVGVLQKFNGSSGNPAVALMGFNRNAAATAGDKDTGEIMKSAAKLAGLALMLSAGLASSAIAQGRRDSGRDNDRDGKWERLGCEDVGRRADFDVVKVGRREGRFSAIRLHAQGNSVSILDLKVVYANGQPDDIQVRSEIREGDRTRPLDLRGRDRAIDSIQIVSKRDFRGPGRGKARVCVFGRES